MPFLITGILGQLLALLLSSPASAGNTTGNGGDDYSREFVTIGYELAGRLHGSPIRGVSAAELALAVAKTEVVSKQGLTLHGRSVDAINYPDAISPKIEVSQLGWNRIQNDYFAKLMLVLHEYLGILGVDDSRYQISHQLDHAGICLRSYAIRRAIEDAVGFPCDRMRREDLARIRDLNIYRRSDLPPLRVLKLGDLDYLVNLKSLYVTGQDFTDVPDGIFRDLKNLEKLSLGNNRIQRVHGRAFSGLGHLRFLSLKGNEITSLETETFSWLQRLETIDLDCRKDGYQLNDGPVDPRQMIVRIQNSSFSSLRSLKALKICIDFGSAGVSQDHAFASWHQLQFLSLRAVGFGTRIDATALTALPNLRMLHIEDHGNRVPVWLSSNLASRGFKSSPYQFGWLFALPLSHVHDWHFAEVPGGPGL